MLVLDKAPSFPYYEMLSVEKKINMQHWMERLREDWEELEIGNNYSCMGPLG